MLKLRFISEFDAPELVNLYHLAKTALSDKQDQGRHARMIWASKEFAKAHPQVSPTGAYKDLDTLTSHC